MKIAIVIRIMLTILLIFGVYTETGVFTALAMSLIMIRGELIDRILQLHRKMIDSNPPSEV